MIVRISGRQAIKHKAQLQPFQPLLIQYGGGGELKYMQRFELDGQAPKLQGNKLYCGLYMNELAQRITPVNEPLESVFALYEKQLFALSESTSLEASLRTFELTLLDSLGYGVDFNYDSEGQTIAAKATYQYYPEQGFVRQLQPEYGHGFSGAQIQAIAAYQFDDPNTAKAAKYFCRYLLKPLLGHKPLKSRELFKSR